METALPTHSCRQREGLFETFSRAATAGKHEQPAPKCRTGAGSGLAWCAGRDTCSPTTVPANSHSSARYATSPSPRFIPTRRCGRAAQRSGGLHGVGMEAERQQPTANSQQPAASSQQPIANSQQPTATHPQQQPRPSPAHHTRTESGESGWYVPYPSGAESPARQPAGGRVLAGAERQRRRRRRAAAGGGEACGGSEGEPGGRERIRKVR